MKNLIFPCMLVFSIMTATAAQLMTSTLPTVGKEELNKIVIEYVEVVEEEDEAFDFNIAAYLPIGFDAYKSFEEKYGIEFEVTNEEEDEAFDFDTKKYLPIGFGLEKSILNSIEEIEIEEADAPFDFDTKKYLPVGFNASKVVLIKTEI